MQCPKCQSPNVQLSSVAYEQGTSTTTTKTTGTTSSQGHGMGTGAAVGGVNFSGEHATRLTHTSTQRTAFAERAGPPENPIVGPFYVLGSLIIFLGAIELVNAIVPGLFRFILGTPGFGEPGFRGLEHLTWWVIAAAVAWLVFGITKLPSHRANKKRWRKSWICAACGDTFVPDA